MGLFDKKVVATEPPPAPPRLDGLWTMPEDLPSIMTEKAQLQAIYETHVATQPLAHQSYEAKTIETRIAQCDRAIAFMTEARFMGVRAMTEAKIKMCGPSHFNDLCIEAAKIDLEPDWVSDIIMRQGGTSEQFSPYCYALIARDILDLTKRSDEVKAEKKREAKPRVKKEKRLWEWPGPIAGPGMHAKPTKDGRYTHAINQDANAPEDPQADPEDYKRLVIWAEMLGFSRSDLESHYEVIKEKGHDNTKTALRLLQCRIQIAAEQKDKGEQVTQETKTAPEAPVVTKGLFSRPAAPLAPKAEPKAPPAPPAIPDEVPQAPKYTQAEYNIIAEQLGIQVDSFKIDTKERAEWFMKKRQTCALQYKYLYWRKAELKKEMEKIQRQYECLEEKFGPELDKWFGSNNPDPKKKSMEMVWGKIGRENRAESVSLDDEDRDEAALMAWIHEQPAEIKKLIEAVPVPKYKRNLKPLKDLALKMRKEGKGLPAGLKYTAAKENAFYIRPSIDTIETEAKDFLKGGDRG